MIIYFIILLCSIAIGFIVGCFFILAVTTKRYYGGTMKFQRDEDGVYPYVEGTKPLEDIVSRDYVLLKVSRD